MATLTAVPKKTRNELTLAIRGLQNKAMGPGIPNPQRTALMNRAMELRSQLIELEAARFNKATVKYKSAIERVQKNILDLRSSMAEIDDAIKIVGKAAKVFESLHKVLSIAGKFVPF